MPVSLKHKFQSAKGDGTDATLVQPSNWNAEHDLTMAADSVLGRGASAGSATEIPCTAFARSLLAAADVAAARGVLSPFPSGTKMLFAQTSAPAGWTKDTTHNDKTLRVVSGAASSGGSVSFSAAFSGSGSVGSTTLTIDQMPLHNHGVNDPGHTHAYVGSTGNNFVAGAGGGALVLSQTVANVTGITIQSAGGGQGHTHTLPALNYVDVIIATKD